VRGGAFAFTAEDVGGGTINPRRHLHHLKVSLKRSVGKVKKEGRVVLASSQRLGLCGRTPRIAGQVERTETTEEARLRKKGVFQRKKFRYPLKEDECQVEKGSAQVFGKVGEKIEES